MKKGKEMKHELSDIDPQKMDSQKWDMLLDLLEHPEKYSETQKDELLGEEEVNELYQQLVETQQSLDFAKSKEEMKMPSIDAEWEKLKDEMKLKEEKQQKEEMSQNAETQQTAKSFPLWSPMRKVAAVAAVLVVSGITFAASSHLSASPILHQSKASSSFPSTCRNPETVGFLPTADRVRSLPHRPEVHPSGFRNTFRDAPGDRGAYPISENPSSEDLCQIIHVSFSFLSSF